MPNPNLKEQWLSHCLNLAAQPADFYSGCRKILRAHQLVFTSLDDSLQLKDCGFTSNKMRYLERAYMHPESLRVGVDLWSRRRLQDKYGSIGVTCYNHFIKAEKTSKRGSVMGPCIQAFTITYLNKRTYAVDVFYRTTELLKKFPADLVFLRDVLLEPFDFKGMEMTELRCHFANITMHPMYFGTILPLLPSPIAAFKRIKREDRYFHDWAVKWTARYVCPEFHRGIAKFAQALRVQKDVTERLTKSELKELREYIRTRHPPLKTRFAEANEALGQDEEE